MTKELETRQLTNDRPIYEVPRALRLSDQHAGMGLCAANGSGDTGDCEYDGNTAGTRCFAGSIAGNDCWPNGNTATWNCDSDGSSAGVECIAGSGF